MTNVPTESNAVIESILSRRATKYYDPNATLSDDQIRELVRIGTSAPTSFHLQNWRFIAVRSPEAKARLRPIAWDQPATTEAAVTFIVCGQLVETSVISRRLAPLVEAGIMPANVVPDWEIPARDLYMASPPRRRDEAVRTATFGAAAMIYGAHSLGLGSTPMIGFDDEAVHREIILARKGHASDSKRDAAVQFARKVVEARGHVSEADLKAVRDAGYSDANVIEIVALVAMYSLTNFFNNVFDPEKDFPAVTPAGSI